MLPMIDFEKCIGCGTCMEFCEEEVFAIEDGKARIDNIDACNACNVCIEECPEEAITFVENGKNEDNE